MGASDDANVAEVALLDRFPDDGWVRARRWSPSQGMVNAIYGLIGAICPGRSDGAPADKSVYDAVFVQMVQTFPYMSRLARMGLPWIIRVLDWSPIWRFEGVVRLQSLPPEQGSAVLDRVASSRFALLRTFVTAARAAVLTAYFDLPVVHDALGYDPVGFMRERIALRRRLEAGKVSEQTDLLQPSPQTLLAAAVDKS
ncbi:MAG TPA: hypothetical protein DCQ06_09455 [Myxococcales bacterium]|nr:hypothetical protein [Myxococcales bacterium]HAN31809.1 hypothetical protein [Myxococcales bacterium]